jgi:hypothetical protein
MALTWQEQQLLDEMEAELAAEDPALNGAMWAPGRRCARTRVVWAAVAFPLGLAMLVMGNAVSVALSAAGLMVITVAAFVVTPAPASHTAWPGGHRRGESGCCGGS